MRSLAWSAVAGVLGWMIGSVIAAVIWLVRPGRSDVLALSLGLWEALLGALAVGIAAAVLHLALGWAGSALHPVLAAHRAPAIGLFGVLWGVLSFMTTGALVRPIR
jgi:hypothetical protein